MGINHLTFLFTNQNWHFWNHNIDHKDTYSQGSPVHHGSDKDSH